MSTSQSRKGDYKSALDDKQQDLLSDARKNRAEDIEGVLSDDKLTLDVNFQNERGNSALHFAAEYVNKEAVDILLKYGADATIQNAEGKTPLDLVEYQLNANPNSDSLKQIKESLKRSRPGTSHSKRRRTSNDAATHPPKNEQREQSGRNDSWETEENLISSPSSSSLNERQDADNTYYSTGSAMHGFVFQFKLIMFVAQRARKMGHKFRLAPEMEAAEKFDDVVMEHTVGDERCWSFVQAKHKRDDDAKIKSNDLQSTTDSAPFGIRKYFLSFIKIKNNLHFMGKRLNDFAIVTNANFDEGEAKDEQATKWNALLKVNRLNQDDLLYMEGFEIKKYQFSSNDDELKWFMKGNLLVSALASKEISKFPAVKYELENRAKDITEKAGAIGKSFKKAKKEKSEEDQTDSASLEKDKHKLGVIVTKCNDLRKTVRNITDMGHVTPIIEGDTDLKEFIDPTKINSVKDLDKKLSMTISALSIIDVALNDVAFDEYFAEFVKKFRFVTNFPNKEKLGDFNKSKLGETFKLLNADLVSASFEKRMLEIMTCNEGENDFYTEEGAAAFEEKIASAIDGLLTSGLSMVYPEELKVHNIFFRENTLNCLKLSLNGFLDPEKQNKQIFYLCTQSTRLSAIKVLQILENHESYKKKDSLIFIRFSSLLRDGLQNYIFDAFRKHRSHNLLVIDFEDDDNHDEKTLASIHAQVENILRGLLTGIESNEKKIILISQNLELKDMSLNYHDTTSFNDLDDESQNVVLKTEVNSQGTTMSLNRLIDRNYGPKFFDEESLARLLNGNQLKIGNINAFSSNGYVEDYYIERTFHRQIIKNDILKKKDQLFFITSTKKEDLATLKRDLLEIATPRESIVQWTDEYVQYTKWDKGIILPPPVKSDEELYKIFRKLAKNAHWLELHQGTSLFWKLSSGDISLITESIDKDVAPSKSEFESESKEVVPDEHHFCNVKQFGSKVVILANEPGMGKSTVLTSMAKKMRELNDNKKNENEVKWIVRINVNDYANDLSNYKFTENDVDRTIDFVAKMAIPGDATKNIDIKIQRTLFESSLKKNEVGSNLKKPKIVLMFDGFDEICPDYESNTSHLIRKLKESNVAQIWVTTRAHEQDHLQKELGSLAYKLNPLTTEKQKQFLDKYWKWKLTKMAEENPSNCQEILNHLNITLESGQRLEAINAFNFSTLGGELLNKWNRVIGDENEKFTAVPLLLEMLAVVALGTKFRLPEKSSNFNLYHQFIEIKLDIHSKEKVKKDLKVVQANCESVMAKYFFHDICMKLSVKIFFPNDESLPSLEDLELLANETPESMEKRNFLTGTGLLISKGSGLDFIHRSFNEYYFSRYLIKNMSNKAVQKLLFSKIFRDDSYGRICQFFNDQIELPESKKQIKLTDAAMESISKFTNKGSRPFFVHIIENGCHGICELFLKSIRDDNGKIYEKHKKIFKELFLQTDGDGQNVLHCAFIKGDMSIINIILDSIRQHPDIRQKLLLRSDRRGENPLYKLSKNKTSAGSHKIVEALTTGIDDDEFFEDLAIFTAFSQLYVVRDSIENMLELIDESVPKLHEKLNEIQKNFNEIEQKRPDLVNAICSGDEIKISSTENFQIKQILLSIDDNGTILHEAIEHEKTEVVKKILEKVNSFSEDFALEFLSKRSHKSRDGTALHFAARFGNKEIVQLLIENKADVNKKDDNGSTPLHWAAEKGRKEIVQLLIDKGADVHEKDYYGSTPLHWAAKWDVNKKENDGSTPLHWAAEHVMYRCKLCDRSTCVVCMTTRGRLNVVVSMDFIATCKLYIKKIMFHSKTNMFFVATVQFFSFIHYLSGHITVVELLCENGADIHAGNHDGHTSLHAAEVNGHQKVAKFLRDTSAHM
ncbi:uncharacterized protein LOC129573326 [Sitodiplosis mosellana]|uniref:uncharacterized protein LOC129573326 n=1 Tax=Sitodiplosis mosellana TaxID=263140 RepID=UPI002443E87B|nr:uncharacterized protein LOC129573326 [Sitodiplosis mosellana]